MRCENIGDRAVVGSPLRISLCCILYYAIFVPAIFSFIFLQCTYIYRKTLRLAVIAFFPDRYAARWIKPAHLTFNYSTVAIYSKQRVALL